MCVGIVPDPLRIKGVPVDEMDERKLRETVEELSRMLLRCRRAREDYRKKALRLSSRQRGNQS